MHKQCEDEDVEATNKLLDIGRVASWAVGFEKLLNDEMGLHVFTEFLKKEFSQENIQFWIECEKLKASTDSDEVFFLISFLSKFNTKYFLFRFVRKLIQFGPHIYMIQMMVHVESISIVEHDTNVNNHYWINLMHIFSKRLKLRYFNWWNSIHIQDFWNPICIKIVLWVKWKENPFPIPKQVSQTSGSNEETFENNWLSRMKKKKKEFPR